MEWTKVANGHYVNGEHEAINVGYAAWELHGQQHSGPYASLREVKEIVERQRRTQACLLKTLSALRSDTEPQQERPSSSVSSATPLSETPYSRAQARLR